MVLTSVVKVPYSSQWYCAHTLAYHMQKTHSNFLYTSKIYSSPERNVPFNLFHIDYNYDITDRCALGGNRRPDICLMQSLYSRTHAGARALLKLKDRNTYPCIWLVSSTPIMVGSMNVWTYTESAWDAGC